MRQTPVGYKWEGKALCIDCGDGIGLPIRNQILTSDISWEDTCVGIRCHGCEKELIQPNV
jgi:hypothetical protein